MLEQLKEIENKINGYSIGNKEELESFRLEFISRNGLVSKLFDELKNAGREEKPLLGKQLNELKKLAEGKFNSHKLQLEESGMRKEETDLTLPGRNFSVGSEHILIQTMNEFVKIFREIGFNVTDGPEVEDEFHNFDALNTPDYHPSRDMQDTFYVLHKQDKTKKYVLRTHTSPVQIRTMLANKPPIRIVCPGKVYRNETVTYKNYFMFHQVEGLWIDEHITFADLKGMLIAFLRCFFEREDLKVRFRPSFFPFTEPSAEIDMSFGAGWLEMGGAGMVHPNVLRNVNIDSERYQGFAFGLGPDRLTMLRYGVNDLRLFFENDLRFLKQFN